MNRALLPIFFLLLIFEVSAQNSSQVWTTPKFDLKIHSSGAISGDNSNDCGFCYPSETQKGILESSGIWISGKISDTIFASAQFNKNITDFQFGPLSIGASTPLVVSDWDRTWTMSKDEISIHTKNYKKQDYQISDNIKDWPANAPEGFISPLAPFLDWNANGKYEPQLGDAPIIEGDLAALMIFNDLGNNRSISAQGLGVECKQFCYVFKNDNSPILFCRLLVTNRNSKAINNFKLGYFSSVLLGEGNKNFIRTLPKQNSVITYNSSGNDSIYGNNIPVYAFVSLNNELAGSIFLSSDNDIVTGFPDNEIEINNYLSGKWKNGKKLTYGGNGVDGSSEARFVYPGLDDESNNAFDWKEENSGSQPGDRNFIVHFDSIDLQTNQTVEYRFALQVIPDLGNNIDSVKKEIEKIHNLYSKGDLTNIKNTKKEFLTIYPNPIKSGERLNFKGISNFSKAEIIDIYGKIIFSSNNINDFQIPAISEGFYQLKIQTKNEIYVRSLIIE